MWNPLHSVLAPALAGLSLVALSGCASVPGRAPRAGAPESFVRFAAETQTSRTVAVRSGLTKAAAWRAITAYLAERHTVAVRDQNAGFAMTGWEASLVREGVPDLRYRTRLVVTFVGEDWQQLQLRAEANWKEGDDWQVGVDRALLDTVAAELQALVGAA